MSDDNDHQSDAQRIIEIVFPDGSKVEAPYWPQPGHPDNAVTLFLGYGQSKTGRVGTGTGYNAYKVRPSSTQYIAGGAKINVTNRYWDIAVTQGHFSMDDREPVRWRRWKSSLRTRISPTRILTKNRKTTATSKNRSIPIIKTQENFYQNMPGACRLI